MAGIAQDVEKTKEAFNSTRNPNGHFVLAKKVQLIVGIQSPSKSSTKNLRRMGANRRSQLPVKMHAIKKQKKNFHQERW
jgi:hypothetical protein